LFEVAFNDSGLSLVQLAIDVGMNGFQYFLTTQLGTSTLFGTSPFENAEGVR